MDEPRRVGSDLIVDAVAAIKEYGAPVMIIDMGTATTISIVDDKGSYAGGVILPEYVYRLMHLHQEQHSSRV